MTFWQLYYHLVWATKGRETIIDRDRADVIQRSLRSICHDRRAVVHAVGIMPEHVHVAVSIPPSRAISEFVKELKGETSHLLTRDSREGSTGWFGWQGEYGVISFGERSLPMIVSYVENQERHHAENNLFPTFELIDRPEFINQPVVSPGGTS